LLSLVVPVYNEARRLEASIDALVRFFRGRDAEIVFVDDGSTDDTAARVEARARRDAGIARVLRSPRNRGKGHAVRVGMREAKGDPIFFSDVDLSVPIEEVDRFLPWFTQGFDLVIGSRRIAGATIRRHQPTLRETLGAGYTRLSNLVLGGGTTDYTCGFKGFSRRAAAEIFRRAVVDGWSFDAEILYLARRRGLRVKEVPVPWTDSPDTRVRLVHDTARSFAELVRIRARGARGLYD
jgi:dolichyl-phosphate beta-glucosyltransferase